jgi:hypothetical protein
MLVVGHGTRKTFFYLNHRIVPLCTYLPSVAGRNAWNVRHPTQIEMEGLHSKF